MIAAIVDYAKKADKQLFKLVKMGEIDGKTKCIKFKRTEQELLAEVNIGKYKLINGKVENGRIVASNGSFARFKGVSKPLVILSEIVEEGTERTLGYCVANCVGDVKTKPLAEILEYCMGKVKDGGVPIQNGQYVKATKDKVDYIRCYDGDSYKKIYIKRNVKKLKKKEEVEEANSKTKDNSILSSFNPEQLEVLKKCKKNGISLKGIANPKNSVERMTVLMDISKMGYDVTDISNPEYEMATLKLIRAELRAKKEVGYLLNPKYTPAQAMVLSIANDLGLDLCKIGGPEVSVNEMNERLLRLSNDMWKDVDVEVDSTWEDEE